MPFTPYHLGPGLLIKAVMRGGFSLLVFGWAQVLMDLQPLIALSTGRGAVHGWSHTWLGAAVIGAAAAFSGKYAADLALRIVQPRPRVSVRWRVAWVSAAIGTLSHVALDSMMHSDLHPFAPFSDAQPWLGAVSVHAIYLGCVYAGVIGAAVYLGSVAWSRTRAAKTVLPARPDDAGES